MPYAWDARKCLFPQPRRSADWAGRLCLSTTRCGGPRTGFGHTSMPELAIVVANEREVRPLMRDWSSSEREHSGRRFRFFEKGNVVLVCGGIGAEAARRATEAIIVLYQPSVVESAGFAGALEPGLRVGDIVEPRQLIDAGDGSRAETGVGSGTLV